MDCVISCLKCIFCCKKCKKDSNPENEYTYQNTNFSKKGEENMVNNKNNEIKGEVPIQSQNKRENLNSQYSKMQEISQDNIPYNKFNDNILIINQIEKNKLIDYLQNENKDKLIINTDINNQKEVISIINKDIENNESGQNNTFNNNLNEKMDQLLIEKSNEENEDIEINKKREQNGDNSISLIDASNSNKNISNSNSNHDHIDNENLIDYLLIDYLQNENKDKLIINTDINNQKEVISIINKDINNKNDDSSNKNNDICNKNDDNSNTNDETNNKNDDNSNSNEDKKENDLNLIDNNNDNENIDEIQFSQLEMSQQEIISLGINIGAFKTVYSTFREINNIFLTNVLLMNESSRIIPSIICYSNSHRLFGENSISSLKRNLKTSYNNISRLICYEDNNVLNKNEFKYNFNIKDELSFYNYEDENLKEIHSDNIISDYLSLINYYYFDKNKFSYNFTSLSVPDFFNFEQKNRLKLICESIDLKNIKIYNESSAITMYYGYTKYKDLFVNELNQILKTNFKYILFIDSGHSKTNFILSKFNYNKFSVEYVECMSEFGGRNFDELLVKYCFEEFKKTNNLNIEMTQVIKYKLYEEVEKSRKKLTVNTETLITIDALYEDFDLSIEITKDKFEKIIEDYLKDFSKKLQKVIQFSKNNNFIIDYVEIAGELMRTPIIQNILTSNKLSISKTILIDECMSVGASILRSFELNSFPLKEVKTFEFYNYFEICYKIDDYTSDILFPVGKIVDRKKRIDLSYFISNQKKSITIRIYFSENDYYNIDLIDYYLVEYEIDIFNQFQNNLFFEIEIDEELNLINGKLISDKNEISIKNDNIKSGLIHDNIIKQKDFISKNRDYINEQKKRDQNYDLFIAEKSNISKFIYKIKEIIEDKHLYNENIIIQDIDRRLRNLNNNKNGELEKIKNELNEIYNQYGN